ncbi:hypothetical protein SD427_12465 [Chryseobacterium sp. JJR-5R]|uniref:hypothetical protein n=1 Tax=Chryseobacterium sp. JJR-5R TaxID=3093923 RepID=UPI002A757CBD|nr:hypothetical protein [Chryseobacterium sp. JJR-5R]WPO81576.1 hypothetical protein SD427_12465 [Chryseobacterium sp. JJR-5R]
MYGQTNIKSIPTYSDALSNKKYARFAELLKNQLITGKYPGDGEDSHKQMNHDKGAGASFITSLASEVRGKKVTWNSRAAEDVATRDTRAINNKVEKRIK